jgi:hypothetical protein
VAAEQRRRLGAELSAAEGSMAGGGGDAEPVGHLAGRGGRPVSESALRESRGQLRPARHRTTPRRRRRNRSAGPYLRQPHRSACPIRRRGAGLPLGFAVEIEDIVEAAPKTSGYPRTAPDLGFLPIRRVPGCSLPAVRSGNAISRSRARRSSVFLRCLRKRGTAGEAFAGSRRR